MMGMARSLRVEYAGAYYHVMARENRREEISLDEEDRRFFLKRLGGLRSDRAARLKMRSAANVSQTSGRTEWKSLFKKPATTLAEYSAGKNALNAFAS
jgi:hypothetical protein